MEGYLARYTGPVCRHCRREGSKLFLKGQRCFTEKCSFERKSYPPGIHGKTRSKVSIFGTQLREKQKLRRSYGMLEKAFLTQFKKASKLRGVTAEIFLRKLELRLDSFVFRSGFACNRQQARQLISHKHFLLNGKVCNVPSASVKIGDIISLKSSSAKLQCLSEARELYTKRPVVKWFEVDEEKLSSKIVALPGREDIHIPIQDNLIVELYSK